MTSDTSAPIRRHWFESIQIESCKLSAYLANQIRKASLI